MPHDQAGAVPPELDLNETRDRLIEAVLLHVPFDGWSKTALMRAAEECDIPHATAEALFPAGARDLVNWHSRWADRRMSAALAESPMAEMRIRERIAFAVMTRLEQNALDREAIRAALGFLALPQNAPLAAELLYRTVDDIWFACGDRSTDWNFYSKRGLLAGVYSSTLLVWLNDDSEDFETTRGFLDRRIANVMAIPKIKGRAAKLGEIAGFIPRRIKAFRTFRPAGAGRG
ncbi:MAG: COQ9 family protein [Alphaproteobacteria bacterium]|nr:COQ9 family protein [Alphaproteobacteria bacterium]